MSMKNGELCRDAIPSLVSVLAMCHKNSTFADRVRKCFTENVSFEASERNMPCYIGAGGNGIAFEWELDGTKYAFKLVGIIMWHGCVHLGMLTDDYHHPCLL